eukprot:Pgem_evm1s5188
MKKTESLLHAVNSEPQNVNPTSRAPSQPPPPHVMHSQSQPQYFTQLNTETQSTASQTQPTASQTQSTASQSQSNQETQGPGQSKKKTAVTAEYLLESDEFLSNIYKSAGKEKERRNKTTPHIRVTFEDHE